MKTAITKAELVDHCWAMSALCKPCYKCEYAKECDAFLLETSRAPITVREGDALYTDEVIIA